VFLRPVVVRDASSTESLSMDRYDLMRSAQRDAQPKSNALVPVNEAPVLPPIRPASAAPGTAPAFPPPLLPPVSPQPAAPPAAKPPSDTPALTQ